MVSPILELKNINKSFGHVQANKNINLTINQGTIHGIIGENGAGKSVSYTHLRAHETKANLVCRLQ